jgi:hypothetical protein
MKKTLFILPLATVAILLASCTSETSTSDTEEQPQVAETPAPNPSPTPAAETPPKPSQNKESVAGLIPSTDPSQRKQAIAQGRNDPFAFVPVQPTLKPLPAVPTTSSPQPPTNNSPANNSPTVSSPPSSPSAPNSPVTVPSQPPLPPQPEIAQAVTITGIVDIGGLTQIIVKAPGERSSRYVQVGEFLSNGQVLVKRIENYQSPSPVVVLEELGQEVYKEVGEGVAQEPANPKPSQSDKTALMLPEGL